MQIKKIIYNNAYFVELFHRLVHNKETNNLLEAIHDLKNSDTISSIELLREFRRHIEQAGEPYSTKDTVFTFNSVYGYWQSIFGTSWKLRRKYEKSVSNSRGCCTIYLMD